MILLWGDPMERPMAAVLTELRRLRVPIAVLSDEDLHDAEFDLASQIRIGSLRVDLAQITAAYLRPQEVSVTTPATARVVEGLLTWAETTPARIVNRPSACAANNSKPYQSTLIRAAGFCTPKTLISTDPDAVRAFRDLNGEVIYKSMSGVRSIVSRLGLEQEGYLDDITHCPTMFQEYVKGCDYRIHVVGDELYACQVESSADDYRYPRTQQQHARLRAVQLDAEISFRLLTMVRSMQLWLAGVDLRLTPEGCWYCFEVNPSPGFSYFSQETGQPIARGIAQFLAQREPCVMEVDRCKDELRPIC